MRVLLVEDDAATAQGIEMMLRSEGYVCDSTDMGEDGLEIGKLYDYDIIVLDLMLPDIDGYEVLRRLRAARVQTPILILSGLNGLDDKIKGLGVGADDYLTKPFDKRELIARIQAIVRRSKGHSDSLIRTGKLIVNLDTRTVEVDGQPLHLTGKEYGILELLSLRKGTTLTKEMFLNRSSASCARSWRRPPAATIISRPSGDVATFCVTRSRKQPPRKPRCARRSTPNVPSAIRATGKSGAETAPLFCFEPEIALAA
jgi:two-component system cell cycle response regulator CtrA